MGETGNSNSCQHAFLDAWKFLWRNEFLFSVGKHRNLTGMAQKSKWRV